MPQKLQTHLVLRVNVDRVNPIHAVHKHLEHVLSIREEHIRT